MSVASPSDLHGRRVLVTGASGFTGRYMVSELRAQGCHVVALGAHARIAEADECLSADLRDAHELAQAIRHARADLVVHLAALAFVGHGHIEDFYNVNLMGTRNLLEALEKSPCAPERILLASSANVYGNSLSGVLDEQTPPAPANDYAVSKLSMEYVAALWRERLPITIARPFNYTGVGQSEQFLVPKIVSHFASRASVMELGNLDVSRDFGDVRAVVCAYRRLLEEPAAVGQLVNVCTGRGHSLAEIVSMCEDLTGHRLEIRVNPAFVRSNEVKVLLGDNQRLRSMIGDWTSPPLQQTLSWMLDAATQH
ncbi:GDP-mannose 4,6-dehydratase [Xanthomonas bonasiae]|uniref:GDP-mannose 4,6-dehydratase n=1 Tax=Xanthomonas bonasiae TaxID=2810351 RepID=UPI00197D51F0|nr:GDP-mannose 4,6-dehydratase [Xanthomonas bonasiae]MBN6109993.1 GDP-mannose 4,6-dehydratase [Xanthomonas bonasiae]